ncbi:TIGR04438 family Trp-rich protein [Xylophilus sp. ASV27]|uniref:TIGR04438 family Trp-rich protein n=1 Tax=Xylophilus sp. ASV27 TaxID=2795129 RepID=UPI0018ECF79E|nr:TIGR04438 family Trp-rich protein [Xylophilus sp. ASV27]
MYFLGLGIILLLLKWLAYGPVAHWSWWIVLAPFALAAAWWAWADGSGLTKRREMDRMARRKQDRIDKSRAALGQGQGRKR